MILTKDNLIRVIREKKYVTPTTISETFETSTMIASAALSELSKDNLIKITNLKLGSSPYYYDPKQKEALIELGKKHFSSYDKEALDLLEEKQVINDASLTIQLRLAIERIKDFAIPLEIEHEGKNLKFWVWYIRDIKETQKQISDAIKGNNTEPTKKSNVQQPKKQAPKKQTPKQQNNTYNDQINISQNQQNPINYNTNHQINNNPANFQNPSVNPFANPPSQEMASKSELFIEEYFKSNYLKIENKIRHEKYIKYTNSITINKIKIIIDAIYYLKKPQEAEVLKFYTSSNKPKIVFIESAPKKLFKLAQNLDNLTIVNI